MELPKSERVEMVGINETSFSERGFYRPMTQDEYFGSIQCEQSTSIHQGGLLNEKILKRCLPSSHRNVPRSVGSLNPHIGKMIRDFEVIY